MAALAITRFQVASYVETLLLIYIVLIFIRIVMSYFPRIPYIPALRAFLDFVESVTDPYLKLFRRIVPQISVGPGAIDLSPMVATIVLIVLGQYVLVPLIAG
ncbi:MAG: hypothetical protein QOG62_2679 [Thermoleophilaceae bacterium]|jgi:YggT family protein|nr:hypothetical protein [Thermoleophilaceae bacterium]